MMSDRLDVMQKLHTAIIGAPPLEMRRFLPLWPAIREIETKVNSRLGLLQNDMAAIRVLISEQANEELEDSETKQLKDTLRSRGLVFVRYLWSPIYAKLVGEKS